MDSQVEELKELILSVVAHLEDRVTELDSKVDAVCEAVRNSDTDRQFDDLLAEFERTNNIIGELKCEILEKVDLQGLRAKIGELTEVLGDCGLVAGSQGPGVVSLRLTASEKGQHKAL